MHRACCVALLPPLNCLCSALLWFAASAERPPLWGVPVAPAGPEAAAAGPAEAGAPSLLTALQQLQQAAMPEEVMEALNAAVAAAAAEQGGEVELGEEEEEREEAADADMAAAIFQQLQQAAPAAAAAAAAAEEGLGAAEQPGAAGRGRGTVSVAVRQHLQRLQAAGSPSSTLWSLLGSGIAQWEVAHRDPACE